MTLEQFTQDKMENRFSLDYWKQQLDPIWLEQMAMIHRGKNIPECIEHAYADLICQDQRLERATASDFKRLVNSWLANKRQPKKSTKINIDDL